MTAPRSGNEFELIARYFAPLAAGEPGALGLIDDAAVLSIESGRRVVVTTDTLVCGVHFLPSDPPETVARKMLAVNLSDLAAMGALPVAYTMSIALPETWTGEVLHRWLGSFAAGLSVIQAEMDVNLIGGDTVATPGPICLTVTALGSVREGAELRRSAAKPGDTIYVSGTIGDAALGLRALTGRLPNLTDEQRGSLIERYRSPEPRVALGQKLVGVAHGAADVSDGLFADLEHICVASRLSATLQAALIPLSAAAEAAVGADPDLLTSVLTGGDDYELVFTASPDSANAIKIISRDLGLTLTEIGRMDVPTSADERPRVRVVGSDGRQLDLACGGYRHF
jgi:thiamine-monophosphate kinase